MDATAGRGHAGASAVKEGQQHPPTSTDDSRRAGKQHGPTSPANVSKRRGVASHPAPLQQQQQRVEPSLLRGPAAQAIHHRQQQQHLDSEDRRVKELTESVLYDFLPAALHVMLPHGSDGDDPEMELDADRCRAVAGAALCASALMNAPPGFLEFLLCVPWRKLSQLYPKSDISVVDGTAGLVDSRPESMDKLISNLHVTDDERRRLVNSQLEPMLLAPLLEFLYRGNHAASMPPLLQLTAGAAGASAPTGNPPKPHVVVPPAQHVVTLETVAAVLDGATPLHCAALRGNPSQVDHFLFCGANPAVRTAAGELPIELVPVCGELDAETGQRVCRCMGPMDQEVWECRSRLARSLMARRSLLSFQSGIFAWLHVLILSILCLLGQWGWSLTTGRPSIASHVASRREASQLATRARITGLMSRMRSEAQQGYLHLSAAKKEYLASLGEPPPMVDLVYPNEPSPLLLPSKPSLLPPLRNHSPDGERSADGSVASGGGMRSAPLAPASSGDKSSAAAKATEIGQALASSCNFVTVKRVVAAAAAAAAKCGGASAGTAHGMPSSGVVLDEAGGGEGPGATGPSVLEEEQSCERAFKGFVFAVHAMQSLDMQGGTVPLVLTECVGVSNESYQTHVLEDEQADMLCCWAESMLLKFRSCSCPGCTALAQQAVRMAHVQTARLLARVEQRQQHLWLYQQQQQGAPMHRQPHTGSGPAAAASQASGAGAASAALSAASMAAVLGGRWRLVGQALARIVYAHMCLLLSTEAKAQPCNASLWRAEQCLMEWGKLAEGGLTPATAGGSGSGQVATQLLAGEVWLGFDPHMVEALQRWARHADSDLYLAEALLGTSLGPSQPLSDALSLAVRRRQAQPETAATPKAAAAAAAAGGDGAAAEEAGSQGYELLRRVNSEVVMQIEQALTLACSPSASVGRVAKSVAIRCWEEVDAAARLRDAVAARYSASSASSAVASSSPALSTISVAYTAAHAHETDRRGVHLRRGADASAANHSGGQPTQPQPASAAAVAATAELWGAISVAEGFPRLADELEAARELQDRLAVRSEALDRLDGVVEAVRRYAMSRPLSSFMCSDLASLSDQVLEPGEAAATVAAAVEAADASAAQQPCGKHLKQVHSPEAGSAGSGTAVGSRSAASGISEWKAQAAVLEAAIGSAKGANVGVSKAKRLLKEMTAQVVAAEAAQLLESVMRRRQAGSGALRTALARAEAATAAISNAGGSSSGWILPSGLEAAASSVPAPACAASLGEVLLTLVQTARRRMESERAAEALQKAASSCRTLSDLPRLEAALLSARKVGAEEWDAEAYRTASDMLARLHEAALCRAALEAAVRVLVAGKPTARHEEAAEAVERALSDAAQWCSCDADGREAVSAGSGRASVPGAAEAAAGAGLLSTDVCRARESLELWRGQAAAEARLESLLRGEGGGGHPHDAHGSVSEAASDDPDRPMVMGAAGSAAPATTTLALSRAVAEAASAGVKVGHARRVLKLMQALEAAMPGRGAGSGAMGATGVAVSSAGRPHGGSSELGGGGAESQAALLRSRLEAVEQALNVTTTSEPTGTGTGAAGLGLAIAPAASKCGAGAGSSVHPLVVAARRELGRLSAASACTALAAALKPHADWGLKQRLLALDSALARAESATGRRLDRDALLAAAALPCSSELASDSVEQQVGPSDAAVTPIAMGPCSATPSSTPRTAAACLAEPPTVELSDLMRLAARAWGALEAERQEGARQDADKDEVERERRNQVERQKQERLLRERQEKLERERALAEKRERLKSAAKDKSAATTSGKNVSGPLPPGSGVAGLASLLGKAAACPEASEGAGGESAAVGNKAVTTCPDGAARSDQHMHPAAAPTPGKRVLAPKCPAAALKNPATRPPALSAAKAAAAAAGPPPPPPPRWAAHPPQQDQAAPAAAVWASSMSANAWSVRLLPPAAPPVPMAPSQPARGSLPPPSCRESAFPQIRGEPYEGAAAAISPAQDAHVQQAQIDCFDLQLQRHQIQQAQPPLQQPSHYRSESLESHAERALDRDVLMQLDLGGREGRGRTTPYAPQSAVPAVHGLRDMVSEQPAAGQVGSSGSVASSPMSGVSAAALLASRGTSVAVPSLVQAAWAGTSDPPNALLGSCDAFDAPPLLCPIWWGSGGGPLGLAQNHGQVRSQPAAAVPMAAPMDVSSRALSPSSRFSSAKSSLEEMLAAGTAGPGAAGAPLSTCGGLAAASFPTTVPGSRASIEEPALQQKQLGGEYWGAWKQAQLLQQQEDTAQRLWQQQQQMVTEGADAAGFVCASYSALGPTAAATCAPQETSGRQLQHVRSGGGLGYVDLGGARWGADSGSQLGATAAVVGSSSLAGPPGAAALVAAVAAAQSAAAAAVGSPSSTAVYRPHEHRSARCMPDALHELSSVWRCLSATAGAAAAPGSPAAGWKQQQQQTSGASRNRHGGAEGLWVPQNSHSAVNLGYSGHCTLASEGSQQGAYSAPGAPGGDLEAETHWPAHNAGESYWLASTADNGGEWQEETTPEAAYRNSEATEPYRSTRLCHFYQVGNCLNGDKCRFTHPGMSQQLHQQQQQMHMQGPNSPLQQQQLKQQPASSPLAATSGSMRLSFGSAGGHVSGGHGLVAGFAFGAPGVDAFGSAATPASLGNGDGQSDHADCTGGYASDRTAAAAAAHAGVTGASEGLLSPWHSRFAEATEAAGHAYSHNAEHPILPDELTFSPTVSPTGAASKGFLSQRTQPYV